MSEGNGKEEDVLSTLSIDQMLEAEDVQYVIVPVPEWKGKVRLASVSAAVMMDFVEANQDKMKAKDANVRLIVQSIVDDDGVRLADEVQLDFLIARFKKKDVRVMNRLMDAVMALNEIKITKAEVKNVLSEVPGDATPTSLH